LASELTVTCSCVKDIRGALDFNTADERASI
jgi:hypothetical protein